MKKSLLSILFLFTLSLSNAQTTLICNTFPNTTNLSLYETPSTGYITYSVAANELSVTFNNAPSWSDWATSTSELKWSGFTATDITGLTTPVVLYEIEVSSLTLTGTSCGTTLPLGISVIEGSDYSGGISSNIGYWVGLDTAHFTGIDESTPAVNYAAIDGIAIKPAIPMGCTVSGTVTFRNLCIGEAPTTTSIAKAAKINSSALYPNPVSDIATIAMELNSVSDVKITLSDMMGKEMMVVTEGTISSINTTLNVANLNKGIYSVNYIINGAAAKAELLMVK